MTNIPFASLLMAAIAFPTLALAPMAYAADNKKKYSHSKFDSVKERNASNYRTPYREEKRPENYRTNNRDNAQRDGSRRDRWRDNNRRRDNWRRDNSRRDNYRRDSYRRNRHRDWRRDRRWERRNDRYWRRQNRRDYRRPYWNTSSYTGWNDRYYGYHTNYRSSLGISFIFGEPGYSRYRWAPSRYSFYQPQYTSYSNYQSATYCERMLIDGFHMGHYEQISVLQCNNPYEGSYIVQGSEQVVNCRY